MGGCCFVSHGLNIKKAIFCEAELSEAALQTILLLQ